MVTREFPVKRGVVLRERERWERERDRERERERENVLLWRVLRIDTN